MRHKHTYILTVVLKKKKKLQTWRVYEIPAVISNKINVYRMCKYTIKYDHHSNGGTDLYRKIGGVMLKITCVILRHKKVSNMYVSGYSKYKISSRIPTNSVITLRNSGEWGIK